MLLSDYAKLFLALFLISIALLAIKFIPLPMKVAKKRGTNNKSITILSLLGLVTFGLTWLGALMMAYGSVKAMTSDLVQHIKTKKVMSLVIVLIIGTFLFSAYVVGYFVIPPTQTVHISKVPFANYEKAKLLGQIENDKILEASGIARSNKSDDYFWVHNDSKNEELIFAVGKEGEDLGSFRINGVTMRDWEATASYEMDGESYIVIADVGDNSESKRFYNLYAVREPDVIPGQGEQSIDLAWHLRFQYEDGPRNCEAMAIDESTGEILLLSKFDTPQRLYRIPIPKSPKDIKKPGVQAEFVTEIKTIPQPDIFETMVHYPEAAGNGRPTAFDISKDGNKAVILTYTNAYIYEKKSDESWTEGFGRVPKRVPAPVRSEAAGFVDDEGTFFIIPEHGHVPLYRFDVSNE